MGGIVDGAFRAAARRRAKVSSSQPESDDDATSQTGVQPPDEHTGHEGGGHTPDQRENTGDSQGQDGSWDGSQLIENQLPTRVVVHGADENTLSLAPFERRELTKEELKPYDRNRMTRTGIIRIEPGTSKSDSGLVLLLGLWPALGIAYVIIGANANSTIFWIAAPAVYGLAAIVLLVMSKRGGLEIARWTKQMISLFLVLLVAVGVPAVVMWYSTGLDTVAEQARSVGDALRSSPEFLSRFLQLVFIAVASSLPALMYFVFDREQLGTLRERFIQQVFRLDPSLKQLSDMKAKYGPQIEEVYGASRTNRARLLGGRLSPIIVATLLLTTGWTLTMLHADVTPGPGGDIPTLRLFVPDPSVVTFAFLGAYFFAIQLVLRSYLRGDLRPKAYGQISIRVLVVVILAWVLQEIVGKDTAWLQAAVFIAGTVPETTLKWIQEFVRDARPKWLTPGRDDADLTEPHPLTRLEGIDIYDLTRLAQEGVTNVEALAHHELVDLMLKTRIPASRLVDWVDQAILYLHVCEGGGVDDDDELWKNLHRYGIRTATDLSRATDDLSDKELAAFMSTVGGKDEPPRVKVLLLTMADDEWLRSIQHWRETPDLEATTELPAEPAASAEGPPAPEEQKVTPSPKVESESTSQHGQVKVP